MFVCSFQGYHGVPVTDLLPGGVHCFLPMDASYRERGREKGRERGGEERGGGGRKSVAEFHPDILVIFRDRSDQCLGSPIRDFRACQRTASDAAHFSHFHILRDVLGCLHIWPMNKGQCRKVLYIWASKVCLYNTLSSIPCVVCSIEVILIPPHVKSSVGKATHIPHSKAAPFQGL